MRPSSIAAVSPRHPARLVRGRSCRGCGPGEIPGIRADRRPWAAWALVIASLLITVGLKSGLLDYDDFGYSTGLDDPWRAVTTLFAYISTGYEAVTVGTIALFGWLLERRHGWWAPLLVFFVAGAGGAYVSVEVAEQGLTLGANGAALGMLAAWSMRDILGRRKGFEDDSDLLGVLAIAAVLVLLPLATTDATGVAGVVGGVDRHPLRARVRAAARALELRVTPSAATVAGARAAPRGVPGASSPAR